MLYPSRRPFIPQGCPRVLCESFLCLFVQLRPPFRRKRSRACTCFLSVALQQSDRGVVRRAPMRVKRLLYRLEGLRSRLFIRQGVLSSHANPSMVFWVFCLEWPEKTSSYFVAGVTTADGCRRERMNSSQRSVVSGRVRLVSRTLLSSTQKGLPLRLKPLPTDRQTAWRELGRRYTCVQALWQAKPKKHT